MVRLRLLLACLLIAAIPSLGLAGPAEAAVSVISGGGAPGSFEIDGHKHAHHDHGAAATGGEEPQSIGLTAHLTGAAHECGACVACGHAVGLSLTEALTLAGAQLTLPAAEPVVRINGVPVQVPDKPPRD